MFFEVKIDPKMIDVGDIFGLEKTVTMGILQAHMVAGPWCLISW
jgi:hypothetical protein